MKIHEAMAAVMGDVRAVAKTDRNESQKWNFRGVDAVVNAVGPAMRKHGVVLIPTVLEHDVSSIATSGNKTMRSVVVSVRYVFIGPEGDQLEAVSVGEAFDSGDKATAKAMSVALRTCLLQSLLLPTDDPDPDHELYEVQGEAAGKVTKPASGFSPARVDTWPDVLSAAQAKRVAVEVCYGKKDIAAKMWDDDLGTWSEWPKGRLLEWVEVRGTGRVKS
jgi:hypothetical protein